MTTNLPFFEQPVANLALKKEGTYFNLVLAFSILFWFLIFISIIGGMYAVMIGFFIWLGAGLLIANLKADGIEITPAQMPELHHTLLECCQRLGVDEVPRIYVIQAGGLLNAFTTRHAGRNFIALYSDIVEAYGADSAEMKFVIGHEIGHIQRNHILKSILLAPGLFIPLLGNAYNRACESSCDRYGAYAAADLDGSVSAMMILSGGKECGRLFSPATFAAQHRGERGFFKSWYELLSGYPTLSQRVADLQELENSAQPVAAPRHPLAYFFGLCTPSGGGQGLIALIVFIYIFAILAGIAVPAIVKAREKAEQTASITQALAEGEIRLDLIGTWKHGGDDPGNDEDFFNYTTERKPDGTYATRYAMRTDGDGTSYTVEGKWRATDTSYIEVDEDGDQSVYTLSMQNENTATFTDPEDDYTTQESRIER